MIVREPDYYKQFLGKKLKINFYNTKETALQSKDTYIIGILKKFNESNNLITFTLSPKMCKKPYDAEFSEEWEIENVIYSDQDQIFENYYWSEYNYYHCVVSDIIKSMEIIYTFEDEIKLCEEICPLIQKKYLNINFPFADLVKSYFDGFLLIEI